MAMFPTREREAFFRHWRTSTLVRPDANPRTIVVDGAVAGNIGSWESDEGVFLGYWLGRDFWGRGAATAALQLFLAEHEPRRPIHAHVVATNVGSIRVLEKCGFELAGSTTELDPSFCVEVEELLMTYAG